MIANCVTDTGDKAGNKAGMALSPGDFRLMMEREESVEKTGTRCANIIHSQHLRNSSQPPISWAGGFINTVIVQWYRKEVNVYDAAWMWFDVHDVSLLD